MTVPTPAGDFDPVALEESMVERWKEENTFINSVEQRRGGEPFIFLEGPPTANGLPGIHHVLARTYKDLVCRWRAMEGRFVERKGGWDTHGLPVEIGVQNTLDLGIKSEVEAYGIGPFNEKCRESVWEYESEWRKMTERMAFWVDLDDPYVTLHNDYIESTWWAIKQMWEKDLFYKGNKVLPFCPQTGTSYSSHEVALGYKEVEEPSVYLKFKLVDDTASVLAWTTTPWTLPGNVGLAVGSKIDYVRFRITSEPENWEGRGGANVGEELILAADLMEATLRHHGEVIETVKGSELVGMAYEPLFPSAVERGDSESAWTIVAADFVTTTDGTGVVHTAVMYGEEDYRLGLEVGFPEVHTVDVEGKFIIGTHHMLDGRYVKDCDDDIIFLLHDEGKLYREKEYSHDYPHCWRTGHPLLYYAMDSWFVKMSALKEKLIENNNKVEWAPPHVGDKRFGEWLADVKDWAFSRDRFWGTPLPIWTCEGCGEHLCVGGRDEMALHAIDPSTVTKDLHRPFVDAVQFKCENCGGVMNRVPYIADVWFDSGCAFFAQWHHPFDGGEKMAENYPVDYISEGIDQTRGWFYTLLAVSTAVFDNLAYKSCLSLGHVLDREGRKMSKSLGNAVDPWTHFNQEGADAVRWYLITSGAPWAPLKFDPAGVREGISKFFLTLWNVFKFHADYAALDGFDPEIDVPEADSRPPLDRWVLSRLAEVVDGLNNDFADWEFHKAGRRVEAFLQDDLSNWYVRRSRRRLWGEDASLDKRSCQHTLHETLITISRLIAPMAPFVSDHIHRSLMGGESVHLADWVEPGTFGRDEKLESKMEQVRSLVETGRRIRSDNRRRQRLPCREAWVVGADLSELSELIEEEVNVEKLSMESNLDTFQRITLQPNKRSLGQKVRQDLPKLLLALENVEPEQALSAIKSTGLELEGFLVEAGDVEVVRVEKEGYAAGSSGDGVTLVLDMTLDERLLSKGLSRDITRRIQSKRKDLDLDLEAMIELTIWLGDDSPTLLESDWGWVLAETRAVKDSSRLILGDGPKDADSFKVDDVKVLFNVMQAA